MARKSASKSRTIARRQSAAPAARPARVVRVDGWENQFTGVGTSIDRRTFNTFGCAPRLTPLEIDELLRGDDMAAKIVNKPAQDMMRAGFEVTIEAPPKSSPSSEAAPIGVEGDESANPGEPVAKGDAFPPGKGGAPPFGGAAALPPLEKPPGVIQEPDQNAREQSDALKAALEELEVNDKFTEALKYRRGKGGSAIYVGVDDGGAQDKPLNPDKIKAVKFLTVFEAWELFPVEWYNNPFEPKFGTPSVYRIQPRGVPTVGADGQKVVQSTWARVHETRLIIFQGVVVSREHLISQNGWGDSVLNVVMTVLRDFDTVWSSTAALVADYSQPIFKIKALAEALAADRKDVLKNRINALMMSRSLLKAAVIDAEEDFQRETASLTGLAELLDKFDNRLAAAANMPLTILTGTSPGGMNATGESDIRGYYDSIDSARETDLRKPLERLIRLVLLSKEGPTGGTEPDDWKLKFCPLWQMSETEKAAIGLVRAQTDDLNIKNNIYTAEEAAASRYAGPDSEITIDFEARKKMAADHAAEAQKRAADLQQAAKQTAKAQPQQPQPGA